MLVRPLGGKVRLFPDTTNYIVKKKKNFRKVDLIASSVDWQLTYAYYRPNPPTPAERRWFEREVSRLREELERVRRAAPRADEATLKTVEARIAQMREEFESYPFSDRRVFFAQRIKFLRRLIRESVYAGHEQGA
ncbi:MAG: hypothetical protein GXO08_05120 [Aquificae bacterium]|nr:hypothetical protein [Aquificota bacterium]